MTTHPTENPHPERGPLWVQWEWHDDRPAIMDGTEAIDTCTDDEAKRFAAQLGQDLPSGFTLGVIATGAALIAADPDGTEWERNYCGNWYGNHRESIKDLRYAVRRVAKPAKVRVKVGDAYGRTIDGERITDCGRNSTFPNGWYALGGCNTARADADGMVEVDPLDGDR